MFVAKNSDATSWHERTSSARFAPSFVRQPNGPECTQIVQNAPKRQFRVQCGGLRAFVQKMSTRLRGTNFALVRPVLRPECDQIERNTQKHQFMVQWGGSDAFIAKNSDGTLWHDLLH